MLSADLILAMLTEHYPGLVYLEMWREERKNKGKKGRMGCAKPPLSKHFPVTNRQCQDRKLPGESKI